MSISEKHLKELAREVRAERFDITPEGLYVPRMGAMATGEYFGRVNGGKWEKEGDNLITAEGFAHILNTALDPSTSKPAGHYLAIFSGSTAPAANWTAASFAAVASEIVSQTEGHTSATRPTWTPAKTNTGSIDNMAAAASLTIATASTLNVTGAALLTSNQRGGTSGALVSASLYAAPRVFQNGDVYELGYRINLTS
ncbi:hypothetical protein [Comamonas kerstersii]|uniref:hypothetical protein n=1 Tax=Comamonas kerstersii TaxID=225992 RepID=UPI00345DD7D1